jgi:hypothetical protein
MSTWEGKEKFEKQLDSDSGSRNLPHQQIQSDIRTSDRR